MVLVSEGDGDSKLLGVVGGHKASGKKGLHDVCGRNVDGACRVSVSVRVQEGSREALMRRLLSFELTTSYSHE